MKKVLGLYNQLISNPFAYCKVKKCFITQEQYLSQKCERKKCVHLQILSNSDNYDDFIIEAYDVDKWINYRLSGRPMLIQNEQYERNYRKKNLSSIPKLKRKLKEEKNNFWYNDLQKYYQTKYN